MRKPPKAHDATTETKARQTRHKSALRPNGQIGAQPPLLSDSSARNARNRSAPSHRSPKPLHANIHSEASASAQGPRTVAPTPGAQASLEAQAGQTVDQAPQAQKAAAAARDGVVVATAGGAARMGLGMVISGVLGYIQTVAMTHMVSRSTYGVFVVVFTTVVFISQVSKAGQGSVLLRFLPAYRTRREHGLAGGLVRFTVFGPTIIGLVCATLLFLFAAPLSHAFFHSNVYIVPFREAAVIIPLSNLQGMLINGLCAIKAFDWQVYVGKVIEPLATPTLMVIFFLLGLRLEALIFAYIFGILISVVAGWFVFTKAMREITHEVAPVYAPRTWMRFGSAMLFTQMTASLIQSTDVLSLGVFSTASQVSLYRVADRVSSLIDMPFYAITAIFSPTIAELHVRGEHKKLASMYALVTRWAFTLSLPVFLCSIVFSKPILRIFGGGYTAGGAALAILAAGNMINSATGPAGNILAMTGRVRILWFNTALQVSVNLALIFTLVPRYALLGAAMASSLTVIVFNLVAVVEVWWTTKAQPYRWEMVKPVVAGIAASAFGLLLLRVTGLRTRSDVWTLAYTCMLVGAFVVVYALALVRMGLTSDDKMIFAAIRAKFRRA